MAGSCDKTLRFGAILPLSGEAQTFGTSVEKGIQVALDELQAEADMPIEVPVVDSESNPEKAAELLDTLFDDGALAAVGGVTSPEANAMIAIVNKHNRVLLSPSASSPSLTGAAPDFYRIYPDDTTAGRKMASFAAQDRGFDEVVIVAEQQPYATGIRDVFKQKFEELGGTVTEAIEYPPNTNDFTGIIERVMTLAPDAVYLAAYDQAIGMMIQALRRANFRGAILTTSAFASPSSIARVGEDAVGVILTQTVFEPDSEHAHVRKFVDAFREKYDEDPDIYAAHGYDAMKILVSAMLGRPNLPSEVEKGLRNDEYAGVTGSIRFDDKGNVTKFPRVYQIGEDYGLYDYNQRVMKEKERLREEQERIRRQLEELRREAARVGSGG